MDIYLKKMTKELCRTYMQNYVQDPALFANPDMYKTYVFDQDQCDVYFERHQSMGRVHFAVMLDSEPIGEIILKKIDYENKHCTMGICMKNDSCKNKGYGTAAEILALNYAFDEMKMQTVFADALLNNTRSIHVLNKVGFYEIAQDDLFRYFRCDKIQTKIL